MSKNTISECIKAAKALDEILSKRFLPIPDDWFTVQDYAKETGCSETTARNRIRFLSTNNKLKKKEWSVPRSNGRSSAVPIYKNI